MRAKSLFHKKLICTHCQGSFKKKKYRNKTTYVCSKADNSGECHRIPIDEEFLLKHLRNRLGDLPPDELVGYIEKVEIEDKLLMEFCMKDQENIKFGRNHIVF